MMDYGYEKMLSHRPPLNTSPVTVLMRRVHASTESVESDHHRTERCFPDVFYALVPVIREAVLCACTWVQEKLYPTCIPLDKKKKKRIKFKKRTDRDYYCYRIFCRDVLLCSRRTKRE
jgi:hypothetical protein